MYNFGKSGFIFNQLMISIKSCNLGFKDSLSHRFECSIPPAYSRIDRVKKWNQRKERMDYYSSDYSLGEKYIWIITFSFFLSGRCANYRRLIWGVTNWKLMAPQPYIAHSITQIWCCRTLAYIFIWRYKWLLIMGISHFYTRTFPHQLLWQMYQL